MAITVLLTLCSKGDDILLCHRLWYYLPGLYIVPCTSLMCVWGDNRIYSRIYWRSVTWKCDPLGLVTFCLTCVCNVRVKARSHSHLKRIITIVYLVMHYVNEWLDKLYFQSDMDMFHFILLHTFFLDIILALMVLYVYIMAKCLTCMVIMMHYWKNTASSRAVMLVHISEAVIDSKSSLMTRIQKCFNITNQCVEWRKSKYKME